MNLSVPLNPHLEQFLREQLASGHFRTEGDIIVAALQLLEDQTHGSLPAHFKHDPVKWPTRSSLPNGTEQLAGRAGLSAPRERRGPRGILADIASHISPIDFKAARREMWSSFPNDEAR